MMTTDKKFATMVTLMKYAMENADLKAPGTPTWHGEWISRNGGFGCICSECKSRSVIRSRYCPHCGARMDGGAKDV